MEYLPIAFLAGILTILAPCVLPLLPVIIGGSLTEKSIKRPVIITLSLAASIVIFTLLLKASTLFIDIPSSFWKYFSSTIIFVYALSLLFPNLWSKISSSDTFGEYFKTKAANFSQKNSTVSSIFLGMSLGPVFASCSPTYFLILGTVLPASLFVGVVNLVVYALGLSLVMFIVSFAGQKVFLRVRSAANPNGWFKKVLGVIFLLVAISVATGYDKKAEAYLLDNGLFSVTSFEQDILESVEEKNKETDKLDASSKEKKTDAQAEGLPVLYPAPEIAGLENWINSDEIQSLDELKGKVVLIDFWTYSCINCIRTLPSIQALHEEYADDGLVIIGVHAPEFAFEQKIQNVQNAVDEFGLTYPVVQDNDFATWRNFENRYWPAKYLIDKEGNVRYTHFGEGEYEETEMAVQELLNAKQDLTLADVDADRTPRTPETYLGLSRRSAQYVTSGTDLATDEWLYEGEWKEDEEKIYTDKLPAKINMVIHAASANLVLGGSGKVTIMIDGEKYSDFEVTEHKLYPLFDIPGDYSDKKVELEFTGNEIEAFAFTFG